MFLNKYFFLLVFWSWFLKFFFKSWACSESLGQPYIVYITESWIPRLSPDSPLGPQTPLRYLFKPPNSFKVWHQFGMIWTRGVHLRPFISFKSPDGSWAPLHILKVNLSATYKSVLLSKNKQILKDTFIIFQISSKRYLLHNT